MTLYTRMESFQVPYSACYGSPARNYKSSLMAEESLLSKFEQPERASSDQLSESSARLKLELQCVCNKVDRCVGTILLIEWLKEILKTLNEAEDLKQSSSPKANVKDVSSDQFVNNCELLIIVRPNGLSPASSVDCSNSFECVADISSVFVSSDIDRRPNDVIDNRGALETKEQGTMLTNDYESQRDFFDNEIRKTDSSDDLPAREQDNFDDAKDAKNTKTMKTDNYLDLVNAPDVEIINPRLRCEICLRVCRSFLGLKVHLRKSHTHKKLSGAPLCSHCGIQLKDNYALKQHIKKHTGEYRPYMCQQCDKRFMKPCILNEHIRFRHGDGARPYLCMHCSRDFPTLSSVRKHEAGCLSDEIMHPCDLCDKKYRNSLALARHKRSHVIKEPPVAALRECTYCKKMFRIKYIEQHIRLVHFKERLFKCTHCELACANETTLKFHKLTVHRGERPFACTFCEKKLASAWALRRHEAKHRTSSSFSAKKSSCDSDEKQLECVHCKKRFVRSSNLTVHMKMFHSAAAATISSCSDKQQQLCVG